MKFGLKSTRKPFNFFLYVLIILSVMFPGKVVTAQDQQPDGPVYVVQDGDSLWDIALRFGVSMDDLEQANGITNPNQLSAGAKLVIPGLEGIHGELTTETISLGETLRSLSRKYQVSTETLVRLNHLTSPIELYAGSSLIIPEQNNSS
jgi:spore germination protein